MFGYSETEILDGLKKEDPKVIKFIYKKYFKSIRSMVFRFRNMVLDAEDVFQEGLTRSIVIIRDGKFKGKSTFYTFFYSICRNICLKEIGKPREYETLKDDYEDEQELDDTFEKLNQLLKAIEKLESDCRQIIDLRFRIGDHSGNIDKKLMKFEEVAETLDINADNARQRFKRCMEKLKREVISLVVGD